MSFEKHGRPSVTIGLAQWAVGVEPSAEELALADRALLDTVAGSPQNPPTDEDLRLKVADCLTGIRVRPDDITWASAAGLLRTHLTRAAG